MPLELGGLVVGVRWLRPSELLWFVTLGVASEGICGLVGRRSFYLCVGRSFFCWSRFYVL